jgi:hypothetical protein
MGGKAAEGLRTQWPAQAEKQEQQQQQQSQQQRREEQLLKVRKVLLVDTFETSDMQGLQCMRYEARAMQLCSNPAKVVGHTN